MARKITHKTLLILILVLVPPYFLVFTDEGSRISDNVVLWLFGEEAIKLDFKALDTRYGPAELRTVFPELDWTCADEQSSFGDSVCTAAIGSVNDYPSRRLDAFFKGGRLMALKILYREQYHYQLLGHLIEQLGQPVNVEAAVKATPDAAPVLEWDTGKGVMVLKKELGPNDEPSLFWLAAQ